MIENFPGRYNYITELGDPVILNNGMEFSATYFIMLLALLIYGGGKYVSVDYWLKKLRLHGVINNVKRSLNSKGLPKLSPLALFTHLWMTGLIMFDIDIITLSRFQFAASALYHFLFVPLTLGLSVMLAVMNTLYVVTGNEIYKDLTKYWGNYLALTSLLGLLPD